MVLALSVAVADRAAAETWCGLAVEPERRCSPYDSDAYRYPRDLDIRHVEARGYQVAEDGKIDLPYPSPYVAGIAFRFVQSMDIEHVVPRSEAHDSGMCGRPPDEMAAFARDAENIQVASAHVNRYVKRAKEPHEWLPDIHADRYVWTWAGVKRKYRLTVDPAERDALERVVGDCAGLTAADFRARGLWPVGWLEPRLPRPPRPRPPRPPIVVYR